MNANELADALDDVVANYIQMIADVDFSDVATMLRQQQAEIEALKAGKIRAYDNGVEDGRKPNTNLVKELTDDKIAELIKATNDEIGMKNIRTFDFTKVLLRKAQEK